MVLGVLDVNCRYEFLVLYIERYDIILEEDKEIGEDRCF